MQGLQTKGTKSANMTKSTAPLTATCVLHDLSTMTDTSRPKNDPSQAMPSTMATASYCEIITATAIATIAP